MRNDRFENFNRQRDIPGIRPFAINVAGAFRSMASAANLAHLARPARRKTFP